MNGKGTPVFRGRSINGFDCPTRQNNHLFNFIFCEVAVWGIICAVPLLLKRHKSVRKGIYF